MPDKKFPGWGIAVIVFVVLALLGLGGWLIWYFFFRAETPEFGLALVENKGEKRVIDLQLLEGKIDSFWNWQIDNSVEDFKTMYNWDSDSKIKFLPMLWGPNDSRPAKLELKALMLANEPDMVGGCVGEPWPDTLCKTATSSGYWLKDGAYGCFGNTIYNDCTVDNLSNNKSNTFKYLVRQFIRQCADLPDSCKIASPAMAQNARGTCPAYPSTKEDGTPPTPEDPQIPGKCKESECSCNGWLSLLKKTAMDMGLDGQKWWKRLDAISIHAYYRKAHHVKSKIIDYMRVFKEDKKEIWLTEVAYVDELAGKTKVEYITEAAKFARELLYASTNSADAVCDEVVFNYPIPLPGLLTNEKFDLDGVMGTWRQHGLTLVTWFAVNGFPNFPTGCNKVRTAEMIWSFPFEDDLKTPNELYRALFP